MSDPTDRNRLDAEESPYLEQHADNPVHWQPWDEAALAAARERDDPVFLSVGYAACHWCHVMEEESFQDEAVADYLNEHFVPIKVDREERPDLDSVYQTVCQMVTGRGGWPLSVWLTPDGEPFYVGTYFPRESRRGTPGFLDLLERIRDSWETDREEVEQRAAQWTDAARGELEETPGAGRADADEDLLLEAADAALRAADREHGGFGTSGPKFPQPSRLDLLWRAHERTGRDAYRAVATEALDGMAAGGVYDHVGGGFHRYATDREWVVPHFEKMLYDNATLPLAYLAGYRTTGEERYAAVARETLDFVERELAHPDGGFYGTLDARSRPPAETGDRSDTDDQTGDDEHHGTGDTPEASGAGAEEPPDVEGAFYVWTPAQVHDAVEDDDLADLFCARFGVDESGNFEGGRTVPTVAASVADLATEFDLSESEVESRLETARERAFAARERRPRPARDEKVIAAWNGLAVSAFAEGALALDPSRADVAERALSFVRRHLWDEGEKRLARRYKDGDVAGEGFLEDYAFLARGAFDCYQATGKVDHLAFAVGLARALVAEFWDGDRETLYFTPESGERLVARPQELTDQSTPSSLGVAADVLLVLDHFVPGDRFAAVAEGALDTHAQRVASSPLEHATLALAADRLASGSLEVTVAADELPADWRERLGTAPLPGRVLARRPPTAEGLDAWLDALGVDEAPPIWTGRERRDGEPTLYVCRSFTCSPPLTDVEDALEWAEDLSPAATPDGADGG